MKSLRVIIPFSKLALGGKFKYIPQVAQCTQVYVKIGNDRTGGCIARWDPNQLTTGWVGQGVYSLNNTGEDIDIEVVG